MLYLAPRIEITNINQINNNDVELFWKNNELTEIYIQIQYRLIHSKSTWVTDSQQYNHSTTHGTISNLETNRTYKFRLVTFDVNNRQLILSSSKLFQMKFLSHFRLPIPQITNAWVTVDGQITIKWKIDRSNRRNINGFIIYYRSVKSNGNYTTITIPNLAYPSIDTYTIRSIEPNKTYKLHVACYSNRGLSPMSNSIEISIPPCK